MTLSNRRNGRHLSAAADGLVLESLAAHEIHNTARRPIERIDRRT